MKRFFALLAIGAISFGLSTNAHAQVRGVGAGALVLDDGHSHTITIETPQLLPLGNQAYTDWSNAGFPAFTWNVPVPPVAGAQSGFIYPGPQNVGSGPTQLPYWVYPGETSNTNGSPVLGGSSGTWNYATTTQLGILTAASLAANVIPKSDGLGGLVVSSITDDGSTVIATEPLSTTAVGNGALSALDGDISSGTPGTTGGSLTLADASSPASGTIVTTSFTDNHTFTLPDINGTVLLLQPVGGVDGIQQMNTGTADGIAIQEGVGATGAFENFYDQFNNPLFTVGNTGSLTAADQITISNTTGPSIISDQFGLDALDIVSAGGVGSLGLGLGTSGSPETGLDVVSSKFDIRLLGQTQTTAIRFEGQGALGIDLQDFGAGGYSSGIHAVGNGNTSTFGAKFEGNATTTDGVSNSAISLVSGEINIARQATAAASNGGANLISQDDATATDVGPSGVVDFTATVGVPGANATTTTTLVVHNIYAKASSIIIATPQNTESNIDNLNESVSISVEARGPGVFTLRATRHCSATASGGTAWTPRIGFIVINANK